MNVLSNCQLCGLPNPVSPARDQGRAFCCRGCLEVFRCFGAAAVGGQAAETAAAPNGSEAYLWIDGMHCTSCEYLIEKLALGTRGILAAASSYATSTAKIVYDPEQIRECDLPAAVGRFGYRARLRDDEAPVYDERPELLRVLTGGCLAGVVMMLTLLFISPIHAGLATPADFDMVRWVAFDVTPKALFVLSSILVFYVGLPILRGAAVGIRVGALNMDCLLALSILATYGYSVVQLFRDPFDLYFEVAGTLVAVVTVGRFLERGARETTTRELARIMDARRTEARVLRGGECFMCPVDGVAPGDRVVVRQGEMIPVDGTIVAGIGAVDESLLTGEPFPAARQPGERVLGGALLQEGQLEIDVGDVVESRISSLAGILWRARSNAAGAQGRVDRIARAFVPGVLMLAVVVGLGLHIGGATFEQALLASLATLIVSCPCTFGLAIPLTTASAINAALRRGILVTSTDLFERGTGIDVVAIDKTGTLSTGEMSVLDIVGPPELVPLAAAVERDSTHPVARAIAGLDRSRSAREVQIHIGRGACGNVGQQRIAVGSRALFDALCWQIPASLSAQLAQHEADECVVSYVGWDGAAQGAIVTRDRPRPEWEQVVARLREFAPVVLLTGAEHPGGYDAQVDEVFAGVPPEAKAAVIRRLKSRGRVAMIGDGSNDAPALAQADLGIAFGAPTALAARAADIVIANNRLDRVLDALDLITATRRRIRQNLAWALSYNALAVPLAMAGLLNPLFAALAMSASSILVVLNATRPLLRETALEPADASGSVDRAWVG